MTEPEESSASLEADPTEARRPPLLNRRPKLGPVTRIFLLVIGWLLVVVGIAGLFLPGLQGILTLLLAGAVLSLVSPWSLRMLRLLFRPWPGGWRRLLHLRLRLYQWLERRGY